MLAERRGSTGSTAGNIESPATLQIKQVFPDGALSCRKLMVPMTHDYYSGVLSHYRPLDATRPIVPCILIFGQANESGAVPELVRPRAKVKWILGGTRAYKHAVKYHSHRLQTAIVAILAGQQQDTCRDKQHCISSLCLRLITVRAPTYLDYLPTMYVLGRPTGAIRILMIRVDIFPKAGTNTCLVNLEMGLAQWHWWGQLILAGIESNSTIDGASHLGNYGLRSARANPIS